ncbi:ATP-binding protein [Actinokineospora terrae]|uniref:ATP-binding protein n=1 Tax=Actinokineospora terrae TaxID=155974 RepID=UPI0015A5A6B4|nr:ATP-binding protein [Actinokineospora terrae]
MSLRIEATACAQAVSEIRSEVRAWLTARQVARGPAEEILLAVSEAVTNSVEHAYPTGPPGLVIVTAEVADRAVSVVVTDHGHWREPTPPQGAAIAIRGRGLGILRALAARLRIDHGTRAAPGTTVAAEFLIPG